jgi:hypothetical protein
MDEDEILKLGYSRVTGNLYKKDNELFVQQSGEIKKASSIPEEYLSKLTSIAAYKKELANLKPAKNEKTEEKKKTSKDKSDEEPIKPKKMEIIPAVGPMPIVKPQIDVKGAIESFNLFQELKQKLLSSDDYLYIGSNGAPTKKGKDTTEYIKKSGWRKLATVFNLNIEILGKERMNQEDPEGLYYVWTYFIRATAPNGRFQDAEGVATSRDKFFAKRKDKDKKDIYIIPEEKDIMLKAQTVGINRAISDLIGGGAKTAEEVD